LNFIKVKIDVKSVNLDFLMNINCMTLDEFNLVCYASMYGYINNAINYLNNNQGNLFEKYVTIINVYLNNIIKLIWILVKIEVVCM